MKMIIGLPNSGKTTYSQRYTDTVHYDLLNFTTRQRYARLGELVALGEAVFEGVFGERCRRMELLSKCPPDEQKICIWLNTPLEVCLARENRGRPPEVVLHHWRMFEPPTLDEGWDEIIIIN